MRREGLRYAIEVLHPRFVCPCIFELFDADPMVQKMDSTTKQKLLDEHAEASPASRIKQTQSKKASNTNEDPDDDFEPKPARARVKAKRKEAPETEGTPSKRTKRS